MEHAYIPLLDDRHVADILTESPRLDLPPATSGNRFLSGWRHRRGGIKLVAAAQNPRLELVNLESRPRKLILRTGAPPGTVGSTVDVRTGDSAIGRFDVAERIVIPLPGSLPIGRCTVQLSLPDGQSLPIRWARLHPFLNPGEVRVAEQSIVQGGWSIVDLVRRIDGPAVLRGSFRPPETAFPGQEFHCLVAHEGEAPESRFSWQAEHNRDVTQPIDFEIDLGATLGLLRIRFAAAKAGPPGRWEKLVLQVPQTTAKVRRRPPPPAPQLVLLYVLDALRADSLSHRGGRPETSPEIDGLAATGVSFTRHLSVAPSTLPSTMALFTGQVYLDGKRLPRTSPATLAEIYSRAGYTTAAFSGNSFVSESFGMTRGFDFAEQIPAATQHPGAIFNDSAERVQNAALRWLEKRGADEKVLLYLHTVNPHNPYDPPSEFRQALCSGAHSEIDASNHTLMAIREGKKQPTTADQGRIRDLYLGGLAYNDAQIGKFMRTLEARYPPGEVLAAITSDHGEELFEHGGVLHGYTLYEEQLRIPLVLWWPGHLPPRTVSSETNTIDVYHLLRTLVELSEVAHENELWAHILDGVPAAPADRVRFAASPGAGGLYMARSTEHKLVWAPRTGKYWGMGHGAARSHDTEYFFDLVLDPGENTNRVGSGSLEEAWLRSRLAAWINRRSRLHTEDDPVILDKGTREQLEALGYSTTGLSND